MSRQPSRQTGVMTVPVVLDLQGGGALGAYQAGVYQALHEAGMEPHWVIGTSIGAINAALIAGNAPAQRLERLRSFWQSIRSPLPLGIGRPAPGLATLLSNAATAACGVRGFFRPNPAAWLGPFAPVGAEAASFYDPSPLRTTLSDLVDFDRLPLGGTRLTVGAVNVGTGRMRYFDSRDEAVGIDHVMASGALPPAFPPVRIGDDWYWDGGIYSNTPIEAVLDDRPRRSCLIFTASVWQPSGPIPQSLAQVAARQKDLQYASRADSHIAKQKQIHRLRHVIRELARQLPAARRSDPAVRELTAWGCATTMHVVRLLSPPIDGEDQTKDIDFTPAGMQARWQAGHAATRAAIERAPWTAPVDPIEGVVEHAIDSVPRGRPSARGQQPAARQ
jgi:NTE family protein